MLTLWTVRPLSDYTLLQRQGIYTTDPNLVEPHRLSAYRWMAEQLAKRCPPPPDAELPVWAWYRAHGLHKPKPDLRKTGHLSKGEQGVRLEFEIDEQAVLLSSFDGWHAVLNDHCFALTDEEYEYYEHLEQTLPAGEFERVKQQSWLKIFDLSLLPDPEIYEVQAVFWQLKAEQVKKADFFTGR